MTQLSYSNVDSVFEDGVADAKGSVILARFDDLLSFLNGGVLDSTYNINPAGIFAWTSRHSWAVTDTSNHNRSLTVAGVMGASKYGDYLTSAAAQINAPLSYKSLSNASSSVSVEEVHNAGTGDSHKVVNTNTGACYKAETSSTGNPFEAKLRSLDDLSSPLVSKVITTPTALAASTVETVVSDAVVTLPADFLKAGTTIKGTLYGLVDSPAAPADLTINVRYGGVAGTVLLSTGAVTATVNLVNALVKIEFILTCISTGAAGTIEAQGNIIWNSNTAPVNYGLGTAGTGATNGAPIAINTTLEKDLVVSVVWSAATAGCNIEIRNGVIEIKR